MKEQDIIRMAREIYGTEATAQEIRFAAIVAAAQREKVAHWMRSLGYATGRGDTIEALLDHLGTQIAQGLEAEVVMEREACAKVCDEYAQAKYAAAAIRARGNK